MNTETHGGQFESNSETQPDDEFADMTEDEFETFLTEALEGYAEDAEAPLGRIQTFAEAGVLTNNKGLVIRICDAEFQITIVKSR